MKIICLLSIKIFLQACEKISIVPFLMERLALFFFFVIYEGKELLKCFSNKINEIFSEMETIYVFVY